MKFSHWVHAEGICNAIDMGLHVYIQVAPQSQKYRLQNTNINLTSCCTLSICSFMFESSVYFIFYKKQFKFKFVKKDH